MQQLKIQFKSKKSMEVFAHTLGGSPFLHPYLKVIRVKKTPTL